MDIRRYQGADEAAVIELWMQCGLTRPWNDPAKDIARKLTVQPELFLVGHRGWVNYLAVAKAFRKRGLGRALMRRVEQDLKAMGCPKLNMQIRSSNVEVLAFYRDLGYEQDDTISFGKRLIAD
jgi:GNAT superfamily N-acetyltransferase